MDTAKQWLIAFVAFAYVWVFLTFCFVDDSAMISVAEAVR